MDNELFHSCLGIYSIALAVIGIPVNLLTHVVCAKKPLRKVPTFLIISFLSLFDSISLCFWNIDHFLHQYYDYIQEDLSLGMCRFVTFAQCISLQTSAWLLVTMTIERCLSVRIKQWRAAYFNAKKAIFVIIIVIAMIFFINFHLLFTIDYNYDQNATILGECVTSVIYIEWMEVHIWLYSIIPFSFLLIANVLLIQKLFLNKEQKSVVISNDSKNKRKVTGITVICLTTMFLILTLPQAFTRSYFLTQLSASPSGLSVIFFSDTLAFSYHGLSFLILFFSNKKFSHEIKAIFKINKNSSVVTILNDSKIQA